MNKKLALIALLFLTSFSFSAPTQNGNGFTVAANPNQNETVKLVTNWTDDSTLNTFPSSYGPGLLGNFTITTNASDSLYTNYLQYVQSEWLPTSLTFGLATRRAQTFNIPNWQAFDQATNATGLPPIYQICLKMRKYTTTYSNGTIILEIRNSTTSGSPNTTALVATTNFTIFNSTTWKWYCANFTEGLILTPAINYSLVVYSNLSNGSSAYATAPTGNNTYPYGRLWASTNNGTTWSVSAITYDIQFKFVSRPIDNPTWITFNQSFFKQTNVLVNTSATNFVKPGYIEDFTHDWQWTTPIGWNGSASPIYINIQNTTFCTNNAGANIGLPCLYFNDTYNLSLPGIRFYALDAVRYGQLRFTMINKNVDGAAFIQLLSGSNNYLAVFGMNGSNFRYTNGTTYYNLTNTSNYLGEFLNVTIEINTLTGYYNITVNGDAALNKRTYTTTATVLASGFKQIYLYNYVAKKVGIAWFANFSMKDTLFGLSNTQTNYTMTTPDNSSRYRWYINAWDTEGNNGTSANISLCVGVGGCPVYTRLITPITIAQVNGNTTFISEIQNDTALTNSSFQVYDTTVPSWSVLCTQTSTPFNKCNWIVATGGVWLANNIVWASGSSNNTNNNTAYAINSTYIYANRMPTVFNQTVIYPSGQQGVYAGQNVTFNLSASDFGGFSLSNVTIRASDLDASCATLNMSIASGTNGPRATTNWTVNCTNSQTIPGYYNLIITVTDLTLPVHLINNYNRIPVIVLEPLSTTCTYLGYGDWTIPAGTNCYFVNQTLNVTGDWIINGNVTLSNSTVLMNSSYPGEYGLYVYGNLTSYNGSRFDKNASEEYIFKAYDGAYLEITNSTVSGTALGLLGDGGLVIETSNSIINTTTFSNSIIGVTLNGITPIQFANNTATGNTNDYMFNQIDNAIIYNLTSSSMGYGFYIQGCSNTNFIGLKQNGLGSTIINGNSNVTIDNATLIQGTSGLTAIGNTDLTFTKLLINPTTSLGGTLLNADSNVNLSFYDSQLTGSSPANPGIYLGDETNLYVKNTTFDANFTDLNGNNAIFYNTTIKNVGTACTNCYFIDSTLGILTLVSSNVIVRNSTSSTELLASSNVTRQWYVDVNVTDTNNLSISGVHVDIFSNNGTQTTDANTNTTGGFGNWLNITEYININNFITNYTPHDLLAFKSGYGPNLTTTAITKSKIINIQLNATGSGSTTTVTPSLAPPRKQTLLVIPNSPKPTTNGNWILLGGLLSLAFFWWKANN